MPTLEETTLEPPQQGQETLEERIARLQREAAAPKTESLEARIARLSKQAPASTPVAPAMPVPKVSASVRRDRAADARAALVNTPGQSARVERAISDRADAEREPIPLRPAFNPTQQPFDLTTPAPAIAPPAPPPPSSGSSILDAMRASGARVGEIQREGRSIKNSLFGPDMTERLGAVAGDENRNPLVRGPAAAASIVTGAVEHPIDTYNRMVTAPFNAGDKLFQYGLQKVAESMGPEAVQAWKELGGQPVAGKDAAFAAAQLAILARAGPIEDMLKKRMTTAIEGLQASKGLGALPVERLARGAAVVARAVPTAAAGAAFNPEHPIVGGIAGAMLGGGHAAVSGARVDVGESPLSIDNLLRKTAGSPEAPVAPAVTPSAPAAPAVGGGGGGGGGGVPSPAPTGKGPKLLPTGGGAKPTQTVELEPAAELTPQAKLKLRAMDDQIADSERMVTTHTERGNDKAAQTESKRLERLRTERADLASKLGAPAAAPAPKPKKSLLDQIVEKSTEEAKAAPPGESLEQRIARVSKESGVVGPHEYVPEGTAATEAQMVVRNVADGLEKSHPDAIAKAAPDMATRIPPNAVLVPIPGSTGTLNRNVKLADAIAQLASGATVVDALGHTGPVESSRELRERGKPGLTAEEHAASMGQTRRLPKGRPVILIDNVETTGATAEGARRVLGAPDAQLVTYAKAPIPAGEQAATAEPEKKAKKAKEEPKAAAPKLKKPTPKKNQTIPNKESETHPLEGKSTDDMWQAFHDEASETFGSQQHRAIDEAVWEAKHIRQETDGLREQHAKETDPKQAAKILKRIESNERVIAKFPEMLNKHIAPEAATALQKLTESGERTSIAKLREAIDDALTAAKIEPPPHPADEPLPGPDATVDELDRYAEYSMEGHADTPKQEAAQKAKRAAFKAHPFWRKYIEQTPDELKKLAALVVKGSDANAGGASQSAKFQHEVAAFGDPYAEYKRHALHRNAPRFLSAAMDWAWKKRTADHYRKTHGKAGYKYEGSEKIEQEQYDAETDALATFLKEYYKARADAGLPADVAPTETAKAAPAKKLKKPGLKMEKAPPGGWTDADKVPRKSENNPQGDELPTGKLAVIGFHSGSNRASEIRGFTDVGENVGVAANELTEDAIKELENIKGVSRVFVDSGAFSELNGETITDAEWTRRLEIYKRLARTLEGQLYVVAPDKIGDQTVTLERLAKYKDDLAEIAKLRAHVLVPIQQGAMSPLEFYQAAQDALGVDFAREQERRHFYAPALPMNKAAMSVEDAVAFVRESGTHAVHLLGMGAKNPKFDSLVSRLQKVSPGISISHDSNSLRASVGLSNGPGGGPRALTAAQQRLKDEGHGIEDVTGETKGGFGEHADYTDSISDVESWLSREKRRKLAADIGLTPTETTRFLNKPADFLQEDWGEGKRYEDPRLDDALTEAWREHLTETLHQTRHAEAIRETFGKKEERPKTPEIVSKNGKITVTVQPDAPMSDVDIGRMLVSHGLDPKGATIVRIHRGGKDGDTKVSTLGAWYVQDRPELNEPATKRTPAIKKPVTPQVAPIAGTSPLGAKPETLERIKAVAIRTKDGKVVEGDIHIHAAQKAGMDPGRVGVDYEDGYTTTSGRFVDREEALDIADRAGQIVDDPAVKKELKREGALDSEALVINPESHYADEEDPNEFYEAALDQARGHWQAHEQALALLEEAKKMVPSNDRMKSRRDSLADRARAQAKSSLNLFLATISEIRDALGDDAAELALGAAKKKKLPDLSRFDTPKIQEAREWTATHDSTDRIHTPQRDELRLRLASEMYGDGATRQDKVVTYMIGLPASGKSGMAERRARETGDLLLDTDVAKKQLPEYENGKGTQVVHKEGTLIRNLARSMADQAGDNIIIPTVGQDLAGLTTEIGGWAAASWKVHVVFADLPTETAIERAVTRYEAGGGAIFVDPSYILLIGHLPSQTYEALKHHPGVTSYAKYDTDTPRGVEPRLVERGGAGESGAALEGLGGRGQPRIGGQPAPVAQPSKEAPSAEEGVNEHPTPAPGPTTSGAGRGSRPSVGESVRGGAPQVDGGQSPGSPAPDDQVGPPRGALPERRPDRGADVSGSPRAGGGGSEQSGGVRGETRPDERGNAPGGSPSDAGAGARAGSGDRSRGANGRLPLKSEPTEKALDAAPAVTPETAAEPRAATPTDGTYPTNFKITDDTVLAAGGPKARIEQNLAAIKLARLLAKEGRAATHDEQMVLARYVGWGDSNLSKVFDEHSDTQDKWAAERAELKSVLTPAEYAAAMASTQNAHYTSPEVIRAMYRALNHIGIRPSAGVIRMLEPAAGIGHFFGLAPDGLDLRPTLIELDPTTASILKALYPLADVRAMGYQDARIPEEGYDLVEGNPPFGKVMVPDEKYDKYRLSIHNYFFVKGLDDLRRGGILAFATSAFTMDAADSSARKLMAERGQFLGAVRLPNTAFKSNAGTSVVTDVLFFRKPALGETRASKEFAPDWIETKLFDVPSGGRTRLNEYYIAHPENVIGEHSMKGSMRGGEEYTVEPRPGIKSGKFLEDAMVDALERALPSDIYEPAISTGTAIERVQAPETLREGWMMVKPDGSIWQNVNGSLEPAEIPKASIERTKKLIALRESTVRLRELQIKPDATDDDVKAALKETNALYDAFVKAHGPINVQSISEGVYKSGQNVGKPYKQIRRPNRNGFRNDVSYPIVTSLEDYDPATGKATKTDMLLRRQLNAATELAHVEKPADALAPSLNKFGRINLQYMAQLSGATEAEVANAIRGNGAFEDPAARRWETADAYLSGNVKEKLAQAKQAAIEEPERYAVNVTELTKVIPKDLEPSQIYARLGAPWVSPAIYSQFASETFGGNVTVTYIEAGGGSYVVKADQNAKQSAASQAVYGTEQAPGVPRILKDTLNSKATEITYKDADGHSHKDVEATLQAQAKQDALKQRFKEWLWEDGERAVELAKVYNAVYNHSIAPKITGAFLNIPGVASYIRGNPFAWAWWQKDAIWRMMTQGNTLLAHVVGAGKTFAMVSAGMEMRRLGFARKPLYVVPNHMLEQFSREFLQLYPSANVLIATKADFESKKRKEFVARMASHDWDGIIMTHRSFESVPVSRERQEKFIRDELDALTNMIVEAMRDKTDRQIVKVLEAAKQSLQTKLIKLMARKKKDDLLSFEETGVDQLFVDEAHLFKNLNIMSRMQGMAKEGSDRAFDLYLKTHVLDERTPGRGVVLATGTPISNSMAEMFTVQRYLQRKALRDAGITNFDQWAATFGESIVDSELAPDGSGYRQKERFSRFQNVPELITMFRQVADVKLAGDIFPPDEPGKRSKRPPIARRESRLLLSSGPKLLKPGEAPSTAIAAVDARTGEARPTMVLAAKSRALEAVVRWLVGRAEEVRGGKVDPSEDNFLKITTEGRYAAMDLRLISPHGFSTSGGKVSHAAENIYAIWKETAPLRGTQLVFSDIGVPKKKKESKAVTVEDEGGEEVNAFVEEDEGGDSENKPPMGVPGFNIYDELKDFLVHMGIPAKEIAFIHDAKTNERKQEIIDDVKAGKIRVLLGSTEKMGAGMNAQDLIVALHHLDAPWRPSDIEQRDGRGLRQGNKLWDAGKIDGIAVFRYGTEGSFDAYMWQTLERKAGSIGQVMKGDASERSIEDIDTNRMDLAEMKAATSGNPLVKEKNVVDNQVAKIELAQRQHNAEQIKVRAEISFTNSKLNGTKEYLEGVRTDARKATQDLSGDNFRIEIMHIGQKTAYTDRGKALAAIRAEIKKSIDMIRKPGDTTWIAMFGGMRVILISTEPLERWVMRKDNMGVERAYPETIPRYAVAIDGTKQFYQGGPFTEESLDEMDPIASIERQYRSIPDMPALYERQVAELEAKIADYRKQMGKPLEGVEKLETLKARQKELDAVLGAQDKANAEIPVVPEGSPEWWSMLKNDIWPYRKPTEEELKALQMGVPLSSLGPRAQKSLPAPKVDDATKERQERTRAMVGLRGFTPRRKLSSGAIEIATGDRWLTDGRYVIDRQAMGDPPADMEKKFASMQVIDHTRGEVQPERVQKIFDDAVANAKPAEFLGVESKEEGSTLPNVAYLHRDEQTVRVDADYLATLSRLTGADTVNIGEKQRDPVVLLKQGAPVAVLTPLAPNDERIDVDMAREAAKARPGGPTQLYGFADPFTAAAVMLYRTAPVQASLGVAVNWLQQLRYGVNAIFNAASLSPEAGRMSRIIRPHRAEMDREILRAHEAIDQVRGALDKLDPGPLFDGPRWKWYMEAEQGLPISGNPDLAKLWSTLRDVQDRVAQEIQALGPGHLDNMMKNYMARVYVDLKGPKKQRALNQYGSKRPIQGPRGFKKQRKHRLLVDSIQAALAIGKGPPTDNPLDMVMLKIREMRRYLMAHRIFQEARGITGQGTKAQRRRNAIVKFKKANKPIPDGWAKINDDIATVRAPRGTQGEERIRGHYIAPVEVARVMNNFLSPGLRGNVLYDAYAWSGNFINLVQLGMSGFHAGFVAFDAMAQLAVIGFDQMLRGATETSTPLSGGKSKWTPNVRLMASGAGKLGVAALSAATGPFTFLPLPAAALQYWRGRQMWHAYMNDAGTKELRVAINGLIAGGGRAKMDDYYRSGNIRKLRQALHDRRWIRAGLQAPFAMLEGFMYPLLEHVVPRMKLGAMYYAMQNEMEKLGPKATVDELRKAAARVVDLIDARLGQMIYDNLFWHRITKELLMGGVRSVGWDVGTVDVTVGAGVQLGRNLLRIGRGPGGGGGSAGGSGGGGGRIGGGSSASNNEPPHWEKVQYLAVLAGLVAIYGAIFTYLHTGERPKNRKDLYFPRTGKKDAAGNDERIQPPTYMKDITAVQINGVSTTVLHKMHPLLNYAGDMLQNRDFMGDMIHDEDEGPDWWKSAMRHRGQDLNYLMTDVLRPFSIRNAIEVGKRSEGTMEKAEGFFGLQAAPRSIVRTDAQNMMSKMLAGKGGSGAMTPQQRDQSDMRQQLKRDLRTGAKTMEDVKRAAIAGELSRGQAQNIGKASRIDPRVTQYMQLSAEQAVKVYEEAANVEEKALFKRIYEARKRQVDQLSKRKLLHGGTK